MGKAAPSAAVVVDLRERHIIKAILEFLELKGLHITQLSLERETGVINGAFSDDVLFLRQLIVDGQWDNALDFVQPLKSVPEFDFTTFRYFITKFKFFELLCVKLEPGPLHDNDFAVEELVECLKDLEHICPSPEDYRQLCALLTLPKLSDHEDFHNWNPSGARIECFHKILPLVGHLLPPIGKESHESPAVHDRLVQLMTKGVFYEGCVDYCQAQAVGDLKGLETGPLPTQVLANRPRLSSTDLSLVSWLEMVSGEQFAMPFQQKELDLRLEILKKPKLDAQWTEHILATPVKPGGNFPHSMVPTTKMKFAEKMSQSMTMLPLSLSMTTSAFPQAVRPQSMSQSTAPGFCLGLGLGEVAGDAMVQSQLMELSSLMENSQYTKSSRPDSLRCSASPMATAVASQVVGPAMAHSVMGVPFDFTPVRRQLDEMTRKSLPPASRQPSLPPVPEMSTPPQENSMTQSRLFQEFNNKQKPVQYRVPQQLRPPIYDGFDPRHPVNGMQPLPMPQGPVRPQSVIYPPQAAIHNTRPSSLPTGTSGLPIQFVPIARHEDSQAIRAVAFHPTGKLFAIGSNSKQLCVCKYPDLRTVRPYEPTRAPEILLHRPKQHRGSVYCLGFSPNGELLATGSNDKTLRLMSFNSEQSKIGAEMELSMHDGTIRDVIFLEDSVNRTSLLVSGGAGTFSLYVTDCQTGQVVQAMKGHSAPILGLYSWGGTQFVSCSQDKTIRFWDVRSPQPVNVIQPLTSRSHSAPVTSVCVDPSGKLLVSGHEDASVALFDLTGKRLLQTYRPHGDEVRTVRFSNAAYYLLSGSYDRRIVLSDMRGDLQAPVMYLPVAEHSDKIIQARWHPFDFSFLSTSADRSAVLWALPPSPRYQ